MKFLERVTLTIFSTVILVESIISILLIFGWAKVETISYLLTDLLNNSVAYNVLFGVCVLFILLSIKAILFPSSRDREEKQAKRQDKMGEGVLIENDDGKLLISKETIERLANSVVKNFSNIQDSRTRVMIDSSNHIAILVELQILQNTVIKELNENLQKRIKEVIKEATELEVNEINIKIKNIINVNVPKQEEEE